MVDSRTDTPLKMAEAKRKAHMWAVFFHTLETIDVITVSASAHSRAGAGAAPAPTMLFAHKEATLISLTLSPPFQFLPHSHGVRARAWTHACGAGQRSLCVPAKNRGHPGLHAGHLLARRVYGGGAERVPSLHGEREMTMTTNSETLPVRRIPLARYWEHENKDSGCGETYDTTCSCVCAKY